MASGYPGSVSAPLVGSYFVGQYYQVLQQQPEFAHQFYTDSSTVIRIDGDSSETASAMLQIHTHIMSLNYTGIEIKTINSLESWNGGVLVVVSGSVKAKNFSGKRNFIETFYLAPQEKGYFVLNDIFHFINEEVIHHHSVPVLLENKIDQQLPASTSVPEPAAPDYGLEAQAAEYVNSVQIERDVPVDEYSFEEHRQELQEDPEAEPALEEAYAEDLTVYLEDAADEVPDLLPSVQEPVGDTTKLSYASILRVPKGQSVPAVATRPSFSKSTAHVSEWDQTPQPAVQQLNLPEPSVEASEEGSPQEDEGEFKSVYVRNLPSTITATDIEQEFRNFGRIRPDGVFIRNRKEAGVCYAFVEFEDLQAVHIAIKASPIQLAGRQVYIEERRANSIVGAARGRRGRGRGGYQSEAPRGRFGARSFGRVGNQDGGDFNRSRSNGFRGS